MSRAREVSKIVETVDLVENSIDNIDFSPTITTASAAAVSYLIDGAPEALNTLNELAAALNNDQDFATTVTNELSNKLSIASASATYLPLSGGSISGDLSINGVIDNPGRIGFKAYLSGNTTVTNSAKVPFNITNYNYGNHFNTTNNNFTVPKTGFYLSSVQIRIEDSTNQYIHADLALSGGATLNQLFALNNGNSNGFSAGAGSSVHFLTQGQVVEIRYSWASGGNKTLISQNQWVMIFLG